MFTKTALMSLCVILFAAVLVQAKEWQGLVPLHSTRTDVERLLGSPANTDPSKERAAVYKLKNEVVLISYAMSSPCGSDGLSEWQVPHGTVVSITVSPKTELRLSNLNIDEHRYKKTSDGHRPEDVNYINEEEGESIKVFQGEVISITYFPSAKDNYLRCPTSPAVSNESDAHPYDKLDVYSNITFSEEKAHLDNFAIYLQREPDAKGYIIAYAGRHGRASEAKARAERAKNYLVSVRGSKSERIVTIDGGRREDLTVELYIVPRGAPAPTTTPTVAPSEVQIIKKSSAKATNHRSSQSRCK